MNNNVSLLFRFASLSLVAVLLCGLVSCAGVSREQAAGQAIERAERDKEVPAGSARRFQRDQAGTVGIRKGAGTLLGAAAGAVIGYQSGSPWSGAWVGALTGDLAGSGVGRAAADRKAVAVLEGIPLEKLTADLREASKRARTAEREVRTAVYAWDSRVTEAKANKNRAVLAEARDTLRGADARSGGTQEDLEALIAGVEIRLERMTKEHPGYARLSGHVAEARESLILLKSAREAARRLIRRI